MDRRDYNVIGVMSGTSLDGIDLAHCRFRYDTGRWHYEVVKAQTFPYSPIWRKQLSEAMKAGQLELQDLDCRYGRLTGDLINGFISGSSEYPDMVASHGHTIFHQPEKGITLQIGSGKEIVSATGITAITDFRKKDMSMGGQGAPLVPVGDELLFGEYNYCLNLGGFCNVSFSRQGIRLAYDIAPCNMITNHISRQTGQEMDRDGRTGESGSICKELLDSLNALPFYSVKGPRSLGKEWFDETFLPVVNSFSLSIPDRLRTVYEHIAIQIAGSLGNSPHEQVLVTGGGAHNTFLTGLIKQFTPCRLIIPDSILVDFKEAIVFAFLGLLRYLGKTNCYASVTGARQDSVCGEIHNIKY